MSSSGDHEKAEEVVHELFGATCLIGKLLSLCASNFSLNRVLLKSAKEVLQGRPDVELVKAI